MECTHNSNRYTVAVTHSGTVVMAVIIRHLLRKLLGSGSPSRGFKYAGRLSHVCDFSALIINC